MKKEVVKMEGSFGSTSFADHISTCYPFQGILDLPESEKSSIGFMELLGIQDFSPSLFDMLQIPPMASSAPNPAITKIESSDVLNQPATPNSSSISSESSEPVNDEQTKAVDQEEEQQKTKKRLKPKMTTHKRQREPRFAFMTKSEVDHLEDGYRWRKYGQKAVKNSPFPRSYYRCTTASCNVKKRVERSFSDPSIVVTTYEGQHTHPSPVMPRASSAGAPPGPGVSAGAATAFAMPIQGTILSHYQQYQHQPLVNNFSPLNFGYNGAPNPSFRHERRICTPGPALVRDHGLLQDIVPSNMLKEE